MEVKMPLDQANKDLQYAAGRMKALPTLSLPTGVNNRWFYVIWIPLTVDGMGPCDLSEAHEIVFEVWDQVFNTYGSYPTLPAAIDEAERLNAELLEWEHKDD